jgi:CDGSH-type Zn-finger protein
MAEPAMPQKSPYSADVVEGRSYWWCACGLSKRQPFCDGSHKTTEFVPLEYKATASKTVWFCGCKKTANQPLCDGTHNRI